MPPQPSSPCRSDPSLLHRCPPVSGPPTAVRPQSLVYWRAVASAGVATLLLVAGLVLALGLMDRQARADRGTQSPQVQFAEAPSKPAPAPGGIEEDAATLPAIAPRSPDVEIRANTAVADDLLDRESSRPACETYGTAIQFLSRPAEAARQALHENKQLFVLHVSGNFEDAKFT